MRLSALTWSKIQTQRFGQAIFSLGINQFKDETVEYQLRDIYNDHDSEIIQRIEKRLERFDKQTKR